jgi:DNA-binding NarL/FixJ family response regulator
MISVAIADDNSFLIHSTQEKLSFFDDLELKCTASDGKELLSKLTKDSKIDLILLDIEMPEMDGIEAIQIIKAKYPQIKIIMFTTFDNDENIFKAIKAGADGYLLKELSPTNLHNSIIQTMNGGASMTPSIAMKTLRLLRNPIDIEGEFEKEEINLSAREIQVLEQLSAGIKYDAIAYNLELSGGTIRKHVENIYKKLQVHNRIEAIHKAKTNKLI